MRRGRKATGQGIDLTAGLPKEDVRCVGMIASPLSPSPSFPCLASGVLVLAVVALLIIASLSPVDAGYLSLIWEGPTTTLDGTVLRDLARCRMYFATAGSPSHGAAFQEVAATRPSDGATVTVQLAGLVAGTTYAVHVAALDAAAAESDWSNQVSAAALADLRTLPPQPPLFRLTNGAGYTAWTAVTVSLAAMDAVEFVAYFVPISASPPPLEAPTGCRWPR